MSARRRLSDLLGSDGYLSYAYAYPHKTAYRTLSPDIDLRSLWAREDVSSLFLYIHVPFCEQRCGFCNLFTQVQPKGDLPTRYVNAIARQGSVLREVLGAEARFARMAIGGGTPTYLSATSLDRIFVAAKALGAEAIPTSIEVSPQTLDEDKLAVLRAHHVTRVSMGVQSVFPEETHAVQRRQAPRDVERSLRALGDVIPVRNVDLIYGLPGQTDESLRASIDSVLELGANEIYLYPLYVRPLTILARRDAHRDTRLALYHAGRDHLQKRGLTQLSMRMFSRVAPDGPDLSGPAYRCQDDGMVGLGPGARSYTRTLHYASPFAVGQSHIRDRIEDWLALPDEDHALARHGFLLDESEQRRRYVMLSLLERGVESSEYRDRFGGELFEHFPELQEVVDTGLASRDGQSLHLTDRGVERADVLGDWLQSEAVRAARDAWVAA